MDKSFIDLVTSMRDAQKKYFQLVVSKDATFKRKEISEALGICKRLESQVDRWISEYKTGVRQLLLVDLVKQTDETPGVYNVNQHEKEKQDGGT